MTNNTEPEVQPAAILTRRYGLSTDIIPLYIFDSDKDMKLHPCYVAAKSGDIAAATELVSDLALTFLYGHRDKFSPDTIFAAPHAREATGDNAIPQVLAEVCALVTGTVADTDIVQASRAYHTGADAMERLALRPEFEGPVKAGAPYALVDDVTNLGGTLAELANHIHVYGGKVQYVLVLVNAGRNKNLGADKKTLSLLERRYRNELLEIFGIATPALTANEASYLVGFRSAVEIRNRLAKARQEIDIRLRSKGIERQSQSRS